MWTYYTYFFCSYDHFICNTRTKKTYLRKCNKLCRKNCIILHQGINPNLPLSKVSEALVSFSRFPCPPLAELELKPPLPLLVATPPPLLLPLAAAAAFLRRLPFSSRRLWYIKNISISWLILSYSLMYSNYSAMKQTNKQKLKRP